MLAMFNLGGGEIVLLLIILPITLFWMWTLIDAIQNKGLSDGEKICWVLAILFLQILGAFLYFIIGHSKRLRPRSGS
jgi:hypothetical protein